MGANAMLSFPSASVSRPWAVQVTPRPPPCASLKTSKLFKSFTFSEARGSRLEFRAETFNSFNHTQFNGVSTGFSSSDFGHVTSTYNPRNLQLGLKLMFYNSIVGQLGKLRATQRVRAFTGV